MKDYQTNLFFLFIGLLLVILFIMATFNQEKPILSQDYNCHSFPDKKLFSYSGPHLVAALSNEQVFDLYLL